MTRPVWVIADVDLGIAEMVEYLQTIPGVRTNASCQGTIGEGGPHPYRAQVLASWPIEASDRLTAEFDITLEGDGSTCDPWGYLHPREGWVAPLSQSPAAALGAWMSAALDDPAVCDAMKADIRAWFEAGHPTPQGPVAGWSAEPADAERLLAALGRPRRYDHRYADPVSGNPVWRSESGLWNGQQSSAAVPLYDFKQIWAALSALPPEPPVESGEEDHG